MEVKRGQAPETVERPITINLSRDEVVRVLTQHIQKQLNSEVAFSGLQGIGVEGKLTTLALSGIEKVPLSWTGDTQPVAASPKPAMRMANDNVRTVRADQVQHPPGPKGPPPVPAEEKMAAAV